MNENLFFLKRKEFGDSSDKKNICRTPKQVKALFEKLEVAALPNHFYRRMSLLDQGIDAGGSHFGDAVEIAEIIDNFCHQELTEEDKKILRVSALLHDIGKSGPPTANQKEQQAFVDFFNLNFAQTSYGGVPLSKLSLRQGLEIKVAEGELSGHQAIEILGKIESAVAKQKIRRGQTQITAESSLRDAWSAHVYWTFDLLYEAQVDHDILKIASSHHLIDGHDPVGIGAEGQDEQIASLEVLDKYYDFRLRLMLADKYQAFRRRGKKNHEETVKILRDFVEQKVKNEKQKEVYLKIIEGLIIYRHLFEKEIEEK